MAQAVHNGCRQEDGVETRFLRAFDANLDDLLWADGIIFGTPENFGYMSGALKDFFDRTFYLAEPHQINLPYGVFVSSGNDGTGAVREIDRIVKGYPLCKICEPLVIVGGFKQGDQKLCQDFGQGIAAGLSLGIF
jgi:multimeric flavodoxin WrbA